MKVFWETSWAVSHRQPPVTRGKNALNSGATLRHRRRTAALGRRCRSPLTRWSPFVDTDEGDRSLHRGSAEGRGDLGRSVRSSARRRCLHRGRWCLRKHDSTTLQIDPQNITRSTRLWPHGKERDRCEALQHHTT